MQTLLGVFDSTTRAETAVRTLLETGVPSDSISFITPKADDAGTEKVAKLLGGFVGGAVGAGAGISLGTAAAASLLIPGVGPVVAIGIGAAALLGLSGAGVGRALGGGLDSFVQGDTATQSPDHGFFRNALVHGRSIVVVRVESPETAKQACDVLDRLSIRTAPLETGTKSLESETRDIDGVTIIDFNGRIALGPTSNQFREAVRTVVDAGETQILLKLDRVDYLDSSGIGELMAAFTSVSKRDGVLKVVASGRVRDLLKLTRLDTVIQVFGGEADGIASMPKKKARKEFGAA